MYLQKRLKVEAIAQEPSLDANQLEPDSTFTLKSDEPENFPLAKLTKSFGEAKSRQMKLQFLRNWTVKGSER